MWRRCILIGRLKWRKRPKKLMLIAPWMALLSRSWNGNCCEKNIAQMHMLEKISAKNRRYRKAKRRPLSNKERIKHGRGRLPSANLELTLQVSMQPDPPTNTQPASGTSAPSQARIEFESALGNFGRLFLYCASRSCRMRLSDRTFCR